MLGDARGAPLDRAARTKPHHHPEAEHRGSEEHEQLKHDGRAVAKHFGKRVEHGCFPNLWLRS
jgi:hypothetical protein